MIDFPKYITLELTYRCNYRCKWCWQEDLDKTNELILDMYWKMFKEISSFQGTQVAITGGEPFIRNDIFEILDLINHFNIPIERLLTNGVLLNQEKIEKLARYGIENIFISIDGIGKTHEKYTSGYNTYNSLLRNIKLLKSKNTNTTLFYLVNTKNTISEINDVIELSKFLDVKLNIALPSFLYKKEVLEGESINFKLKYNEIVFDIDKYVEIIKQFHGDLFPSLGETPNWFNIKDVDDSCICQYPYTHLRIQPNGLIPYCTGINEIVGDIKQKNIETIWKSVYFNKKRKLQNKHTPYTSCIRCCKKNINYEK